MESCRAEHEALLKNGEKLKRNKKKKNTHTLGVGMNEEKNIFLFFFCKEAFLLQ